MRTPKTGRSVSLRVRPASARAERGQAYVITVVALAVMLGMAALVLDVGSWFRTQRRLQGTADAAALAGAQALPSSPSDASQLALQYADANGGDVLASDISISTTDSSNDTITVAANRQDPAFFSKLFGLNTVNIKASATALAGTPAQAMYVAPMVVSCNHPLIQDCDGKNMPRFNDNTTLPFDPMGAPGAFGMLNLDGGSGTPGTSAEASWILVGFSRYLGLGLYRSDPGAKFSSSNIQGALSSRVGTVLLFPVFKTLHGTGQTAQYDIIGWIGFMLQSYTVHGNSATLTGYFTTFIAHGILPQSGQGSTNFGVTSVQLIK
jgi:Flp pilus assembly protein TadG